MSLRTPSEVQKGLGWLEKAVSLDPRYGAARATLGESYLFLALEDAGPPSLLLEKTRDLATAALAADPSLAEGHRALGLVHAFRDRDWLAAERRLRTALELAPGMFPNHEALATALLLPLGRIEEAVASQREACARSPLSASAVAMLGRLVDLAGDEAEGIRLLESAIDLEPRYARAYVQLGKLHLRRERPAEAIERELDKRAPAGRVLALSRAEVAWALGRTDDAFRWLERAADEREPRVIYLGVDPLYEPLRADPRFVALLRRLGLKTGRVELGGASGAPPRPPARSAGVNPAWLAGG